LSSSAPQVPNDSTFKGSAIFAPSESYSNNATQSNYIEGISKNSLYPSLLDKGDGCPKDFFGEAIKGKVFRDALDTDRSCQLKFIG